MSATTAVLTKRQALQVTGGRTPLTPPEFEEAVRAIQACIDIDEAKYWSTNADIAAAWAKIYHSDEIMRKARVLKLHAYRRMSELAEKARPPYSAAGKRGGQGPGPNSWLHEQGFSKREAQNVRAVGRAAEPLFRKAINSPMPPTPSWFRDNLSEDGASASRSFLATVYTFREFCMRSDPEDLVNLVGNKELLKAAAITIAEWADRLEQACED